MHDPWWKRFPGRLRAELKALRSAGLSYVLDKESFREGILSLDLNMPHAG
jgi:hypothetical protein